MPVLSAEQPMAAKKKAKTVTDKIAPVSAKLPPDIVEMARVVSALRGETMADLLGGILRPILIQMEGEELAKRTKARERESG